MADLSLGRKLLCAVTGNGDICGIDQGKKQEAAQKKVTAILADKDRLRRALEKPDADLTGAESVALNDYCQGVNARRTASGKPAFDDMRGCRAYVRSTQEQLKR